MFDVYNAATVDALRPAITNNYNMGNTVARSTFTLPPHYPRLLRQYNRKVDGGSIWEIDINIFPIVVTQLDVSSKQVICKKGCTYVEALNGDVAFRKYLKGNVILEM